MTERVEGYVSRRRFAAGVFVAGVVVAASGLFLMPAGGRGLVVFTVGAVIGAIGLAGLGANPPSNVGGSFLSHDGRDEDSGEHGGHPSL